MNHIHPRPLTHPQNHVIPTEAKRSGETSLHPRPSPLTHLHRQSSACPVIAPRFRQFGGSLRGRHNIPPARSIRLALLPAHVKKVSACRNQQGSKYDCKLVHPFLLHPSDVACDRTVTSPHADNGEYSVLCRSSLQPSDMPGSTTFQLTASAISPKQIRLPISSPTTWIAGCILRLDRHSAPPHNVPLGVYKTQTPNPGSRSGSSSRSRALEALDMAVMHYGIRNTVTFEQRPTAPEYLVQPCAGNL